MIHDNYISSVQDMGVLYNFIEFYEIWLAMLLRTLMGWWYVGLTYSAPQPAGLSSDIQMIFVPWTPIAFR